MDRKLHESLREKVRSVYLQIPTQGVYFNSRSVMEFTRKYPDETVHKTYLDPLSSGVIVNALVPKSGVILKGGHGGGKTTLFEKVAYMLTGIPEKEISSSMIRGNDDQNVNTLLATLKLGKLFVDGEEEVIWRNFVKCPVKIIDEINRFPPAAQNALFEIMNRGRAEFIDQEYEIKDFMAFATENPNDTGTYPLSKPFLDRFGFCIPAPQLPSASDQYLLATRADDKLEGLVVKPVMNLDELNIAKRLISKDVKMGSDALIYLIYLTQALTTCERGDYSDKAHNEIPVGERCKGCGFDTAAAVCKMTKQGISGRAFLDFQRWGKAYSWFLNEFPDPNNPEVQLETLQTIAPYLMFHRVEPAENIIGKDPYFGMKMKYLEDVVKRATAGYTTIKDALKEVPAVLRGDVKPKNAKIKDVDKDLVVKYHFQPLIEAADKKEFREIFELIEKKRMDGKTFDELERRLAFTSELGPHAQKYLLSKALDEREGGEHI